MNQKKKDQICLMFCVRKILCCTDWGNVGKNIGQGSECHPASRRTEYKISALKNANIQVSSVNVSPINTIRLNNKENELLYLAVYWSLDTTENWV